ncbi:hypothetical protein [Lichenicola sp.]|uniref:hypothetical protein n=1 Tax=Lichenicola sp. TaxID=2804529 RepID=UPI003B00B116
MAPANESGPGRKSWPVSFALSAVALAGLAVVFGSYARYAATAYPSFDGAMNLNVARSVAEGHGYGFRYDSFFAFPAQTDGPFVLPAVLIFRLFGITLFTSQLVSLLYLVGFGLAVLVLMRRLDAPLWLAATTAIACLLMPGVADYGLDGYGELPMLAWLLAALVAASACLRAPAPTRAVPPLAGLLFGLAVLTKTIALLCVAPALAICALLLATRRSGDNPARRLIDPALLVGGFLAAVLGWELFRLVSLGSIAAWHLWWQLQLGQVSQQSGADAALDPMVLLATLLLHLHLLAVMVGVPPAALVLWLVLPWGLGAWHLVRHRSGPPQRLLLATLLACTLLYFAWWLAITPTGMAWLRRILPGLLLQTCLIAGLIAASLHPSRTRAPGRLAAPLMLTITCLVGARMLIFGAHPFPPTDVALRRHAITEAVARLRALPQDAVIFGVGWWQAPVLALFSDRTVMNFDRWSPARINALPDAYFLVDDSAINLGQPPLREVFMTTRLDPLLRTPDIGLYRIRSVDPTLPMRDSAALTTGFDGGNEIPHTIGWYPPGGGWAWVRRHSTIRLARAGQTRLLLDAAFWSELFPPGTPMRRLHVSAPPCIDQDVSIEGAGRHRIEIPLHCPATAARTPLDVALSLDAGVSVVHQLDADTRDRSFEITTLMLKP